MLIVHFCTHDKVYLESLTHAPSRVRGPSRAQTVEKRAAYCKVKIRLKPYTHADNGRPCMRLLADRPRSCLDPWLLLLSSQPPARVVEALRQHVLQPAAVSRWPERGSNLQPIRIRTRLSGELAAGRLLPCVRASTALALARVTSMRTFGEGKEERGSGFVAARGAKA